MVKRALTEGIPTDVNRIQITVNVSHVTNANEQPSSDNVKMSACGDTDGDLDDDLEMEQEEMFVQAHPSFEHDIPEWGGPRRGGRLPEPTRFGDWERKGRCTDF